MYFLGNQSTVLVSSLYTISSGYWGVSSGPWVTAADIPMPWGQGGSQQ